MISSRARATKFSILFLGLAFLYVPILILFIFSFNESRLVTVWAGFSFKWYVELFQDEKMLGALYNSLKIAFLSSSLAVVLAVMASVVMTRLGRWRGRSLFSAMLTAPLVTPEVVTGLSLLLLFVTMNDFFGWPTRGILTIVIAHVTFCTAYASVVITARLLEMNRDLENAAVDLGATRLKAFFLITLPIISPALVSAWLLSFTLSLDDLVIASFVSGPGSSTLPMEVFSSVRLGLSPKINALSTLLIAFVVIGLVISWVIMNRSRMELAGKVVRKEDKPPRVSQLKSTQARSS